MEHTITIALPNEIIQPLSEIARARGQTLEEFARDRLITTVPLRKPLDAEAARLAKERFARHIGAWDSGDPNSADNERIDADLAQEYGATHEDE